MPKLRVVTHQIVIGSNYGDEGKGRVVNEITPVDGIVVLTNGGSQRGHTVINEGVRHVFHHFGSATLKGCPSYACKEFILNPINFIREYNELTSIGIKPILYIDGNCRMTTPFDMLANVIRENLRGSHRSTGCGIKETIDRYENSLFLKVSDLVNNFGRWAEELLKIKEYYSDLDWIKNNNSDEANLIKNDNFIINNFIKDLDFFFKNVEIKTFKEIYDSYDTITFEQGQGLALDKDYDKDNGTPTHTGSQIAIELLKSVRKNIYLERYYVTRSYLSRHGDGKLDNEDTNLAFIDETNQPNQYQGTIRFALFNENSVFDMLDRIKKDEELSKGRNHLFITHRNEVTNIKSLITNSIEKYKNLKFNQIYLVK